VASLAYHAIVWTVLTILAVLCLARAWALGRGGMDEQYRFLATSEYGKVQAWGITGFALLVFALFDVFLFFNPEPASR
jgi:hypothetical protein